MFDRTTLLRRTLFPRYDLGKLLTQLLARQSSVSPLFRARGVAAADPTGTLGRQVARARTRRRATRTSGRRTKGIWNDGMIVAKAIFAIAYRHAW